MQSLADFLGVPQPAQGEAPSLEGHHRLEDITDPELFCKAVVNSLEFRTYILHGLTLGTIPSAVVLRVLDHAGWQKPPERVEHTGKNGQPIESVTEIRRVVVRGSSELFSRFDEKDDAVASKRTH